MEGSSSVNNFGSFAPLANNYTGTQQNTPRYVATNPQKLQLNLQHTQQTIVAQNNNIHLLNHPNIINQEICQHIINRSIEMQQYYKSKILLQEQGQMSYSKSYQLRTRANSAIYNNQHENNLQQESVITSNLWFDICRYLGISQEEYIASHCGYNVDFTGYILTKINHKAAFYLQYKLAFNVYQKIIAINLVMYLDYLLDLRKKFIDSQQLNHPFEQTYNPFA